jgi:hypothetical protein
MNSGEQRTGQGSSKSRSGPWVVEIPMSFVLAYVLIRGAASALVLTYASDGREGVLYLLLCSLFYFGFVWILTRWELIQKGVSASWLYLIKGAPESLCLGVIAVIAWAFMRDSEFARKAYAIGVLLILSAITNFISALKKLLLRVGAWPWPDPIEGQRFIRSGVISADAVAGGMDGLKNVNAAKPFSLAACYVLDSGLWTLLLIHYRYYSHSFLVESSWVMVSLWVFLLSCWLHSAGAFLMAYRWSKSRRDGLDSGAED